MTTLSGRLLGSPEITFGGQPLPFRTRKALALMIYLVIEREMHSREALMALLWPEFPAPKAAVTLRVTLSRLRQALRPAGDVLIAAEGKVGFDFNFPIDLDLAWLSAAVLPETPSDSLTNILDIDRGEFLAGFSLPDAPDFDNWAAIQREACQRQVEIVYDRLSQHLLSTHDSDAAVAAAARWVRRALLSEQAYRRLMAAQALNGQRSAALQTYQQLQIMLGQELGVKPSRETTVLADNIGRGRLGEERQTRLTVGGEGTTTLPERRLTLPLVGRAAEHGQLVAAFGQIAQGGAQVVVLVGAAGVGKTRLVSAFQDWVLLNSAEAEIWRGRAFETGGRLARGRSLAHAIG